MAEREEPHILVISHNIFSPVTAMGKSLMSMFSGVRRENIAQLFFHSEIPTSDICTNYFRITDENVLKSIFTRKPLYRIYGSDDIKKKTVNPRTDTGITARIYQMARKKTALNYLVRDLGWKMGIWNSAELNRWVSNFSPNVIFFASGDYVFSYRIAYVISKKFGIPIVFWCCDDYYIRRKKKSLLDKIHYNSLMKWARLVSERSKEMIVISDKMKKDYSEIFKCSITVLRISAEENPFSIPFDKRNGIVYVGGLGVNRMVPIMELGREMKKQAPSQYIDVYSNDKNSEIKAILTEENGFRFHGEASAEEVSQILGKAKFVLYTEAFDDKSKQRTRYSLSTKIGESLRSGACIVAYGPRDISSIEYIADADAAIILKSAAELPQTVTDNSAGGCEKCTRCINNALALAEINHDRRKNEEAINTIFESAIS